MSLLAELLSKIKQPPLTREVPPNLKSIVQAAASRSAARRKITIMAGMVLLFVLAGIIAVYFLNAITDTSEIEADRPQLITNTEITPDRQAAAVKAMRETGTRKSVQTGKMIPAGPAKQKITAKKQKPESIIADTAVMTSSKNENAEKSVRDVEEIKEVDPVPRDALLYKAREFEMIQDYSSALATYRKVLMIDSNNVMVLNSIAYIYLKLGLVQESLQYAHMSEKLDADYIPALINLGIAYAKSGNKTTAENYLERAFTLEPDNKNAIFNLALLNETGQNYPRAAEYFTRLIKLGDTAGTMGLGRIYEKQGRNTEALTLYKKASLMEHLDQHDKLQIRQRILVLQHKNKGADNIMPAGPATDTAP